MEKLLKPIITEKSLIDISNGKYVFKVHLKSNKTEVAKAVEKAYKVNVTSVNIINIKPRKRRFRFKQTGWTKSWKKAIITLAKKQKIADFDLKEEKK